MGVVVSTSSTTSPLFLTSAIIGFVSFAFTVSTFLKVVWTNLSTASEAPHQVHAYLTNLRQELLEERQSVRAMRRLNKKYKKRVRRRQETAAAASSGYSGGGERGERGGLDELDPLGDVTLKIMSDNIRALIRRFASIEKPFLEPGERGIMDGKMMHGSVAETKQRPRRTSHRRRASRRRNSSVSPYGLHDAYAASTREKAWDPERGHSRGRGRGGTRNGGGDDNGYGRGDSDDELDSDDDAFWAQRCSYARYGLRKRLTWIVCKPDAQNLVQTLTRVQVRRIAQQVGGLARFHHQYGQSMLDMEDAVQRIDGRMNRFVGVRRIDGGPNS